MELLTCKVSHQNSHSKTCCCSVIRWYILFYKHLAIYNNEHLPNSITIGPSRSKILPSTKLSLQKLPETSNLLPKWQNFAKTDHTAVTSNNFVVLLWLKFLKFCIQTLPKIGRLWLIYKSNYFTVNKVI